MFDIMVCRLTRTPSYTQCVDYCTSRPKCLSGPYRRAMRCSSFDESPLRARIRNHLINSTQNEQRSRDLRYVFTITFSAISRSCEGVSNCFQCGDFYGNFQPNIPGKQLPKYLTDSIHRHVLQSLLISLIVISGYLSTSVHPSSWPLSL